MSPELTNLIAIIGVGLGLASLMLALFRIQSRRIDDLESHTNQRFDDMNQRFTALEAHTTQRLDDMNQRITDLETHTNQRFNHINERIAENTRRIEILQTRVESLAEEMAEVKGILSVIRDGLPIRVGEPPTT